MPKTPINYRKAYFTEIRGSGNPPLIRRLEFNSVETELGTMVEPVAIQMGYSGDTKLLNVDLTDASFNAMVMIKEEDFQANFLQGGNGWIFDQNA